MTRGEHIAQAVRDYLTTNGLKQSKLTGALLAEIADRTLKHLENLAAKKQRLAGEDAWIREVEALPHLQGIDVRKELAKCQFWCKSNNKLCSKKRFTNWLSKDDLTKLVTPGGSAERKQANGFQAPPTWLQTLNELYPDSTMARGGLFEIKNETEHEWRKLDYSIQLKIREEIGRR